MGKKLIRPAAITFAVAVCLFLFGCKGDLKQGHYEGNFLDRTSDELPPTPVKIDIFREKKILHIDVKTEDGNEFATATVRPLKSHQVEIIAPRLSSRPIIATRVSGRKVEVYSKCYASYGTTSFEFCFERNAFLLQAVNNRRIPYLKLSGSLFKQEGPYVLEDPRALTLTEAVKLSFRQNFDSRIAYEQVVQARYAAMAAYLNLVPHLSSNLIWNAAPNYITYVATIQALAPFLLPSYWFQAKQAVHEKKIKEIALTIMRANLATMVEELAYSLIRDRSILESQEQFAQELDHFQMNLLNSSLDHQSQRKLLDFYQYLSEAITSDMGDMKKLVRQDRFALSKALGFHSLEAVQNILMDEEILPIAQAKNIDPVDTANIATDRSFELSQLDEMKRIAELKKIENLFMWIDPTGDPKQSLGLNTFPQQMQAKSQIREIAIQREQTKTNVHQAAYQLAIDYNEAIESYYSIRSEIDQSRFGVTDILNDALAGRTIEVDTLKAQAQKFMASQLAAHTILANFRIARAKMDRYLLAGYYAELLPQVYFTTTPDNGSTDM